MRNHIIKAIAIIVIILSLAVTTKIFLNRRDNTTLQTARLIKDELTAYLIPGVKELHKKNVEKQTAKIELDIAILSDKQTAIVFWRRFKNYGSVSLLVTILSCLGLLSVAVYVRLTTHTLKTKHSEYPFRGNLSPAIASGLVLAEQLEAQMPERALDLYAKMAEINARQLSALTRPKAPAIIAPHPEQPALVASHVQIPTFAELLSSGQIARGKEMILAFENGQPRRGSFLDIYSAAVAGESGSGKTSTMLFLAGSGIISGGIRFLGIDPHYPHPKSLGFKTKPLWESGLMQMATYKDDMSEMLQLVERTIDNRLKQIDTDTTPVVLIIDELAFLSTTSIGKAIARTMERVSMEGRKCAVYMLASSQTWLTAKTGGSSSVRDTLTSAYVHRIKPKQANLLLQDKTEADKVRKQVKQAGDVLFIPIGDDSKVCQMPLATETDMHSIVRMVGNGQPIEISRNHAHVDTQDVSFSYEGKQTEMNRNTEETTLREQVRLYLQKHQIIQNDFANLAGISNKDMSQWMTGKNMKDERKQRIESAVESALKAQSETPETDGNKPETELETKGVIDFAQAKVNRDSQI